MDWTKASIYTTTKGIEPVCALLMEIGVTGFEIEDSQDFQDFLNDTTIHWDYVEDSLMQKMEHCETCVKIYLPNNAQGHQMLLAARDALNRLKASDSDSVFGRLILTCEGVREEDWANNWKQYFKPFPVGEHLYIKPTWEKAEGAEHRKILEIDPSSSFGTGQHNTTRLCLEALEKTVRPGDRVLDLGCGSGILSIAAMLLGAGGVTGVDIDENSVKIAGENLRQNHIPEGKFSLYCGDICAGDSLREKIGLHAYDVVAANIVADVILGMAPYFSSFLKQDGTLLVSGIIAGRREDVLQELAQQGFTLIAEHEKEDWMAFAFQLAH